MTKESTNICKGIAIFMMYLHHVFYSPKTYEGFNIVFLPFSEDRMLWIAKGCKICVAIFVLLTGYGYAKSDESYEKSNILDTSIKRYFRIMFGLWFIFIIAQITSFLGRDRIVIYGEDLFRRVIYIIIDFLGLANLFGTPTFNATWWYITYAIFLVFLTPYIVKVVRKVGFPVIIIAVVLPRIIGMEADATFIRYLLSLILGVYIAVYDIFERLEYEFRDRRILEIFLWIIYAVIMLLLWYRTGWYGIFDGGVAIAICYFCYRYITQIPFINKTMAFIGIHSMNLFMLHTFIYSYYFKKFIYSFKYWWAILMVLLVVTLLLSVIIELAKKVFGYNKLEKLCTKKVIYLMNRIEKRAD